MPQVPENYKNSLEIGGRMFVVCGNSPAMEATIITRLSADDWSEENILETDLAPLDNSSKKAEFEF